MSSAGYQIQTSSPYSSAMPRHLDHHVHLRQREVRAVGGIVGARRDQLDGVGAEDREVADVLLPHRHVPRVVGVGLRPVAELMAAERDLRASRRRRARRGRAATRCVMRSSRSSRPTPKSTPRASAPSTSTVGAPRPPALTAHAVSFARRASARPAGAPRSPAPAQAGAVVDRPDGDDGHARPRATESTTGRRMFVRFATSSTRTRTAVRSCRLVPGRRHDGGARQVDERRIVGGGRRLGVLPGGGIRRRQGEQGQHEDYAGAAAHRRRRAHR